MYPTYEENKKTIISGLTEIYFEDFQKIGVTVNKEKLQKEIEAQFETNKVTENNSIIEYSYKIDPKKILA